MWVERNPNPNSTDLALQGLAWFNKGLTPENLAGDVVEESDGDLMGDGVNIAARLAGSPSRARRAAR